MFSAQPVEAAAAAAGEDAFESLSQHLSCAICPSVCSVCLSLERSGFCVCHSVREWEQKRLPRLPPSTSSPEGASPQPYAKVTSPLHAGHENVVMLSAQVWNQAPFFSFCHPGKNHFTMFELCLFARELASPTAFTARYRPPNHLAGSYVRNPTLFSE